MKGEEKNGEVGRREEGEGEREVRTTDEKMRGREKGR